MGIDFIESTPSSGFFWSRYRLPLQSAQRRPRVPCKLHASDQPAGMGLLKSARSSKRAIEAGDARSFRDLLHKDSHGRVDLASGLLTMPGVEGRTVGSFSDGKTRSD